MAAEGSLTHKMNWQFSGGIDLTKTKHKLCYRKAPPKGHADA